MGFFDKQPDLISGMDTLKKNERLGNFYLREILFRRGKHMFHYPFLVIYLCSPQDDLSQWFTSRKRIASNARFDYPAKCLVGVSRRKIKKAVSRNRIKRLTREAYRQNKRDFYAFLKEKECVCMMAFIYTSVKMPAYRDIEGAVQTALETIKEQIAADHTTC